MGKSRLWKKVEMSFGVISLAAFLHHESGYAQFKRMFACGRIAWEFSRQPCSGHDRCCAIRRGAGLERERRSSWARRSAEARAQFLATGARRLYTQPDSLQLFELKSGSAVPASAELNFPGPVTALHAASETPRAVVKNLSTGNYEAYRLSFSCAQCNLLLAAVHDAFARRNGCAVSLRTVRHGLQAGCANRRNIARSNQRTPGKS